jgi:hypothetical protein
VEKREKHLKGTERRPPKTITRKGQRTSLMTALLPESRRPRAATPAGWKPPAGAYDKVSPKRKRNQNSTRKITIFAEKGNVTD